MRKIFSVALALAGAFLFALILPEGARAQFTTVTATVKDPNGIPYAGAVMNAVLVPSTGGGYTLSGSPYSGRIGPVTLSSSGSFTVNFGDVTLISPGSPQWQITIDSAAATIQLPLGTGPQSFVYTSSGTTISGSSPVSLTAALNALAPALTNITIGSGTVTSVAATSPIVVTPSPIVSTGTISCPTCSTSSSTVPINQVVSATGAITPIAVGSNPLEFDCATPSPTYCYIFGESSPSASGRILEIKTLNGSAAQSLSVVPGTAGPAGANAPNAVGISGQNGGPAGASQNGFTGGGAFWVVGDGSAGGATTGNGGTGGSWVIGGGNGGAAGGSSANNGGSGGMVNWGIGAGGNAAATGNGGDAGIFNLNPGSPTTGAGGNGGSVSGTGGKGADINLISGNGGAAAVGSTTGRGGNITLSLGSAGITGTPGVPGKTLITRSGGPAGTNTTPLLDIIDTWNTTGVVDALIRADVNPATASGTGSLLLDLKYGGVQKFTVDKTGNVTGTGWPTLSAAGAIPGTPGLNAIPVQSGLMAEYRMLSTETCGGLLDYSGNGNNATGTTGTAPTIIANTGGCTFTRNGAINLPAALNSAISIQIFFSSGASGTGFSGCLICGNGTLANSSGLFLVNGGQGSGPGLPATNALRPLTGILNGSIGSQAHATVSAGAPQSLAWVMDSVNAPNDDRIYLGSTESNLYFDQLRALNGNQTVGNYQLGGIATSLFGDVNSWFSGQIYYIVFYNRILTPAEVMQNAQYLQNVMTSRGVTLGMNNIGNSVVNQFVGDGDSITAGPIGTNTGYPTLLTLNGTWNQSNTGQSAQTMGPNAGGFSLYLAAKQSVDPLFWPQSTGNAVAIWAGTNDNATSAEAALQGYCNQRRAFGWKCFVVTMLSRTGEDTFKNTYDTWMRQNWPQFADGLIDMAADPNVGADGASANTNFFIAGGVHPLQATIYNDELPIFQRAINRYYGNKDFSTATVYASAAAAAVATTAGSESGNTITITMAATPTNCQVGNTAVIAGTTPAGYSNASGWHIRTRSATQITAFINTTGLGAISVQGTLVCPQQQDADLYQTLNFGAGNYTLQSCQGFTGQNIYIQNINAVASTLVGFNGETITGGTATPTTLAGNTTAILQSQLVSSAAAGCNWVRLQ